MENTKSKGLGLGLIIFSFIVGFFAYDAGKTTGREEANNTFLDSAYIESCEENGTSCVIETNQGQKTIACNEYDNCLTQEKMLGEREAEKKALIEKIMKTLNVEGEIEKIEKEL